MDNMDKKKQEETITKRLQQRHSSHSDCKRGGDNKSSDSKSGLHFVKQSTATR